MQLQNDGHLYHTVMAAPIGICILNADTLTSEIVNDKFLEIAGKPYEAIIGKFYWEPFAEARPYYEAALNGVVENGEPYYADEVELMLIRHGKEEMVFVTFVYSPIKTQLGKVVKVAVWVLENTTQVIARRKIEQTNKQLSASQASVIELNIELAAVNEELAASNEEAVASNEALILKNDELSNTYRQLEQSRDDLLFTIQAAGLGTFDLNPLTNRFAGNEILKSWFGLAPYDEIELSLAIDMIADEDRQRVIEAINLALDYRSAGMYDIEYRIGKPNQQAFRVVHAKGRALFNEDKKAIRLSGTLQDITVQKADEQRKNDFIGMVSHELKTPLTTLAAIVQVVNAKLKNNADTFLAGAMDKANAQVKKMTTMINGFLNISRLESSQIMIDKKVFDLEGLIEDVISETEMTVSSHLIRFSRRTPVLVNADHDKISSVIANLVSNAVKYSSKGKDINIKCEIIGGDARVSIADEGIGIKTIDQKHLFDRYYRVEDVNTRHISGFGIGLYLSAEIIRRHDGKIWVESETGKGSVFYFSLPVKA